jgi:hypothetical protein
MALIYCTGLDHISDPAQDDWRGMSGLGCPGVSSSGGRFSGQGFFWGDRRTAGYKPVGTSFSTGILGCAYRAAGSIDAVQFIGFSLGTSSQILLAIDSVGRAGVYRGTTLLGQDPTPVAVNSFNYFELKVTFHTTAGSFELRKNGVTVASGSGVNTAFAGGTTADGITIASGGAVFASLGGPGSSVDDIYLCDATGSVNNDFLGDIRVETLFPNAAGATTNLTRGGTDSGNNWDQVNEAAPNDDTDYNSSATAGDKDTYAFTDLVTISGVVYGVQIIARVRKDDAGSRTVATVARSGATEADGPTVGLGTAYVNIFDVRENKPGGSGWTLAEVNGAQFGIKVVS